MNPVQYSSEEYNKEHVRLQTFYGVNDWQNQHADPCELARFGFFYEGTGDSVKCHFCGLQRSEWRSDCIVSKEHKLHSPQCPLLLQTDTTNEPMDQTLLDLELAVLQSEVSNFHIESERLKTFSEYKKWPLDFIEPSQLALLGFFYIGLDDTVECAFCKIQIKNWKNSDCVLDRHLGDSPSCPLITQAECSNVAIDEERLCQEITARPKEEESGAEFKFEFENDLKEALLELPSGESTSPRKEKPFEDEDRDFCKICLDVKFDAAFLPCGHLASCMDCASKLQNCCICREPIQSVKKVYIS